MPIFNKCTIMCRQTKVYRQGTDSLLDVEAEEEPQHMVASVLVRTHNGNAQCLKAAQGVQVSALQLTQLTSSSHLWQTHVPLDNRLRMTNIICTSHRHISWPFGLFAFKNVIYPLSLVRYGKWRIKKKRKCALRLHKMIQMKNENSEKERNKNRWYLGKQQKWKMWIPWKSSKRRKRIFMGKKTWNEESGYFRNRR